MSTFEHALRVADPTQAQMPDIGLRGDEGHRDAVAQLALAQVGIHDEGKLVGRAKAGCEGHGTYDHVAGVFQQLFVFLVSGLGVIDRADRGGMSTLRSGALDLLESQARPGRYNQVIVVQGLAVLELQSVVGGVDLVATLGDEIDALALDMRTDVKGDAGAVTPPHGHPGIGRDELKVFTLVDDRDFVLAPECFTQFVRGGHATGTGAEDNDMCHLLSPNEGGSMLQVRAGVPMERGPSQRTAYITV